MRVLKTIKPGQNGSQRFLRQYGSSLVKVRYRQDLIKRSLYTTVEIIVDQRELPLSIDGRAMLHFDSNTWVALKIDFNEPELRNRAKQLGARWSGKHKVWLMIYKAAVELGMVDRVIPGYAAKVDDVDLYA